VEPNFYGVWLRYQRALVQRNALLKISRVDESEWRAWEQELADSAIILHDFRKAIISDWLIFVQNALLLLLPQLSITMDYVAGFDIAIDFTKQLAESRAKDRERGHTQLGPHRADLRLKTDLGLVEAVLSRGQKKLFICALKLAQVAFLKANNKYCVVLLDDVASELDAVARSRLLTHLQQLDAQILMTAVEVDDVWPILYQLDEQAKLFHVEHGEVTPMHFLKSDQ
jgi:DNA replication and repair protein RecF